jgi:hypothetical protein
MRKLLMIGVTLGALAASPAAMAASAGGTIVGGTAGAWTGGTIGFFLGGPIGAAIGASTGAIIGASALSQEDELYIRDNPTPYVHLSGSLQVGDYVDGNIRLHHIRGEDSFGYFRAEGKVFVVDLDSRQVVEIRLG